MRKISFRDNIIFQYTAVSFFTTLIIAVLLVLLMMGRVQSQLIRSHGQFYREFINAISENYREILPVFNGLNPVGTDEHTEAEHEHEAADVWEHFRQDLQQYPYIEKLLLINTFNETVWIYPETSDFKNINPTVRIGDTNPGGINYKINDESSDLVVSYFLPVRDGTELVGMAEIIIRNNNLREAINESRLTFAGYIFAGGSVFYLSVFLLFLRLYLKQKSALDRLEKSQKLTIQTMSLLAELKDNDTSEHVQRTSKYCRVLAEELAKDSRYRGYIDEHYIKDLERSAPLHDIGKVGIPENILLKPGRLTEDEFSVIKKHPLLGANVLKQVMNSVEFRSYFEIAYQIVLSHHENWDGSGYPQALSGEDIPLSARIMSIADVYDALTTERPYKEAFSHEKAVEIILEGRGSKFDPALVDHFLNIEKEFKMISDVKFAP